jgi:hypothetical protein
LGFFFPPTVLKAGQQNDKESRAGDCLLAGRRPKKLCLKRKFASEAVSFLTPLFLSVPVIRTYADLRQKFGNSQRCWLGLLTVVVFAMSISRIVKE